MAHLIQKSRSLERKYRFWRNLAIIPFCICAGCFLAWMINLLIFRSFQPVFLAVVFLGFALFGALTGLTYHKANGLRSGVVGERALAQIAEKLPAGYCCFQNLTVTFEGKTSEIDLVVVGATGVFAIEVKNRNGVIQGSFAESYWVQEKIGRGGTPYENRFYSPVKQVGTHVYRLANFLRSSGASVYVEGAVYFSNVDTLLQLTGQQAKIPVFAAYNGGGNALLSHILGTGKHLPPALVAKICQILNGQPVI